jgi:hypothetical protein
VRLANASGFGSLMVINALDLKLNQGLPTLHDLALAAQDSGDIGALRPYALDKRFKN